MIGHFPASQPIDREPLVEVRVGGFGVVASTHSPRAGQGPEVCPERSQACGAVQRDILDETVIAVDINLCSGLSGLGGDEQQPELVPGLEARRNLPPRGRHLLTGRMIVVADRAGHLQRGASVGQFCAIEAAELEHHRLVSLIHAVAIDGHADGQQRGTAGERQGSG